MNCFNRKSTQFNDITRHKAVEFGFTGQSMFFQFAVNQAQRQTCAINRDIHSEFFEEIRNRTDVVLVTMGNDHTADFFFILFQIGKIRNNQVNTQHIRIRESHTAVYDQDIPSVFINRQVLADLIQAAERNNPKGWFLSFARFGIVSTAGALRRRRNQVIIRLGSQYFFLNPFFFHIYHTDSASGSRSGSGRSAGTAALRWFLFAFSFQCCDICRAHHQLRK